MSTVVVDDSKTLTDVKGALNILGCSRKTLYNYVDQKKLTLIKEGRSTRFYEDELYAILPEKKKKQVKHNPKRGTAKKKEIEKKQQQVEQREQDIDEGKDIPTAADCLNDLGKEEMMRVTRLLKDAGVFDDMDTHMIIAYCINYQNFIKYQHLSDNVDGVLYTMKGIMAHPHHKMAMDYQAKMIESGKLLGLNPASRAKIPKGEAEAKDEMEGLIG